MHNPLTVIAVATYVTLVHLGHLVAMASITSTYPVAEKEARDAMVTRRAIAGGVGYALALAVALTYAVLRRSRINTITYWATILLIFFMVSEAVYHTVPKVFVPSDAESLKSRERSSVASAAVHGVALVLAAVAWGVARATLKPL